MPMVDDFLLKVQWAHHAQENDKPIQPLTHSNTHQVHYSTAAQQELYQKGLTSLWVIIVDLRRGTRCISIAPRTHVSPSSRQTSSSEPTGRKTRTSPPTTTSTERTITRFSVDGLLDFRNDVL